jgi:aminoglycoside phosphotransferase family enzyme/predicted kinase
MRQDEIIRRLSSGEGFGDTRPERIDTHVSTIFLAGDDAYKLKRAVATSYLDYSTLEQRLRFCRAEVEINRRTAPGIYLGVVPVRHTADDQLVVGDGPGTPVEWLVHMRRFSEDTLFDRMAAKGALTAPMLLDLADAIAAFHAAAERLADGDAGRRIGAVIDENALEMRKQAALVDRAMAEELDRRCRAILKVQAGRIDRRGADGFLRHCHGDLHLRNICLVEGKPTLFDAIEFSDAISHIDVLYDLAFLLMDLEHRRLRPEANALFNRYLHRTVDIDDLAVLPLYLALRAGIRTHVSAMAAAAASDSAARERLRRDAMDYLRLGLRLLDSAPPALVAVGGLSGVGKSSVARRLAPGIGAAPGAVVLSSDLIRKRLLGAAPLTRLGADAYTAETDDAVYDALMDLAARALGAGRAVILDATFQDPVRRQQAEAIGRAAGVRFHGIWLEASPRRLYERLDARAGDPSDATAAVLARQLENDVGEIAWRRIDAGHPAETVNRTVAEAISQQPARA